MITVNFRKIPVHLRFLSYTTLVILKSTLEMKSLKTWRWFFLVADPALSPRHIVQPMILFLTTAMWSGGGTHMDCSYTTSCNHDRHLRSRVRAKVQQVKGQGSSMSVVNMLNEYHSPSQINTYAVYGILQFSTYVKQQSCAKLQLRVNSQRSNFRRSQKSDAFFLFCNWLITTWSS